VQYGRPDMSGTRWESLFADLEAELAAGEAAALSAEVAERTRIEVARLRLVDRLRPALGHRIRLSTLAGPVEGTLRDLGPDWLLAAEWTGRAALVPLAAVTTVAGLSARSAPPGAEGPVAARLDLRYALRRLARDRAAVALTLAGGGTVTDTLDRVGADFVELAEHPLEEFRRPAAVRQVLTIPLAAVHLVRSS
jgi:hypothetical protein